jgi:hypothetical protein
MTWENLRFDPVNGEVTCGEQLLHLTPKSIVCWSYFSAIPSGFLVGEPFWIAFGISPSHPVRKPLVPISSVCVRS